MAVNVGSLRRFAGATLCLLYFFMCFAGCVTTEESAFTAKVSKDKAIEKEVDIAMRYLAKDQPEMAIKRLSDLVKESTDAPAVYEVLAIAFQRTGEFELAEENFLKALRIDSGYSRGRNNYATYLFSRQRYKEACDQFEKVVEDVYYDRRALAFLNLGQCSMQLERWDDAEAALKRAVALERTLAVAYQEMGWVHFHKKDFAKANEALDRYRRLVKQSSPRALLLGIRVSREFRDKNGEASYVMALRNLYPRSKEYLEYMQSAAHDQR
jgi:type IV pilus assembly protein PilF